MFAKARNHCPGVGSGRLDEPGVDGVSADVLDRVAEVLLAVDHPGSEARTPQMAVPTVPEIEALGIAAVQVLHAAREPRLGRLDEQAVMPAHQAERVHAPSVAVDALLDQPHERIAIGVVAEDARAENAACGHVEETVGQR